MKNKIIFSVFSVLLMIIPLRSQQLVEGVAAVVGKEIILRSEIEQYVQNYIIQNRIDVQKQPELLEKLRKETLSSLIDQQILIVKADEDTITVEDDVLDQQVENRIRYMLEQVGSEEKLEQVFGSPMKKIKKDTRRVIKDQMLVEEVRRRKFADIKVSRREVEEFYKLYSDSLPVLDETVDISHLLMLVKASADARESAYKRISEIYKQVRDGADFSKLAAKYSEDPASAKRGGDLGMIGRGDFVKEFEAAAFALNDGDISEIVQTQFGFHIIQMIERRGEKVRTRHILIRVVPNSNDDERTKTELAEIRQRAMEGEDFGELALQYSDDENVKKDRGHLGIFEVSKLVVPEFRNQIEHLKIGEISQPFKTEFGYHIVKLENRQEKRSLTMENDWQKIQMMALNYKRDNEYGIWLQALRNEIPIEIRPGS